MKDFRSVTAACVVIFVVYALVYLAVAK